MQYFATIFVSDRLGQKKFNALHIRFAAGKRSFLMCDRGLVEPRINLGHQLTGRDFVVEIHENLLDRSGNERTDLHAPHRLHAAGGIDDGPDFSAPDRRGFEFEIAGVGTGRVITIVSGGARGCDDPDDDQPNENALHGSIPFYPSTRCRAAVAWAMSVESQTTSPSRRTTARRARRANS